MASAKTYRTRVAERFLIYLIVSLLVALYLLFIGACENQSKELIKEQDEGLYKRAQMELKRGDYNSALNAFLKLIDERKDSPESHLEAGRIYLFKLRNYVFAIYHFRKYLEVYPNSSDDENSSEISDNVSQMIETAQKRMIASMPQSPYENNEDIESALAKAKKENYELKQRLVTYSATIKKLEDKVAKIDASKVSTLRLSSANTRRENSPIATQRTSNNNSPQVQRDVPNTYTVIPGDTLSSISRKVYGTTSRWGEILRYNRGTLSSPQALKPGQVLRLPK